MLNRHLLLAALIATSIACSAPSVSDDGETLVAAQGLTSRVGELGSTLEVSGTVARRMHALAGGTSDIAIPVPPPITPIGPATSTAVAVAAIDAQLDYSIGLVTSMQQQGAGVATTGALRSTLEVAASVARHAFAVAGGSSDIAIPVPPPIEPGALGSIATQLTYSKAVLSVVQ